jgi:hypothetical protein
MAFVDRTIGFGSGTFGQYPFTSSTDDNFEQLLDEYDDRLIDPADTEVRAIADTLHFTQDSIDEDGAVSRRERFIQTASAVGLERKAELFGSSRRNNESTQAFRSRIASAYAAASSETTYDQFAAVTLRVLDADATSVTLETPPNTPDPNTVTIEADPSVLDDHPLSSGTLESYLEDAVPAGHAVRIEKRGTFEFDGANYTPPSNTGWNEGTFGTVSEK